MKTGRIPPIPPDIQRRLDHPVDPAGRTITWKHPLLVFLAENGTATANPEHDRECTATLQCIMADA